MRSFCPLLIVILLACGTVKAEVFKSPDILVDSKLDFNWSRLLVTKIRRLLNNYKVTDPFKLKFDREFVIDEALLVDYLPDLPDSSKKLINDIGQVLKMDILSGNIKITMQGLEYDIENFKTDLKASEALEDGLIFSSDFSASKLTLATDKVTLSLVVKTGSDPIIISVDIPNARLTANKEDLIKFFAKVKIQDLDKYYQLKFLKTDFNGMADAIGKYMHDIGMSYDPIIIPDASIKFGKKNINFKKDKVLKIIENNREGLKGLLLAQIASLLKSGLGEDILKVLENFKINKEYWLDASLLQGQIQISKFTGSEESNFSVNLPADFCTKEKFNLFKSDCLKKKVTPVYKSRLNQNFHLYSVENMKDILNNGEANFVASISEDYVNKLLVATYDAGLWKETLDKAGVTLGSSKVFMRLDKKGDSGTLYMDVIYKEEKKIRKFVMGEKQIRFPLIMDVGLRVEKRNGVPIAIIHLNNVDLSDETLKNGKPGLDLPSNIQKITMGVRGYVVKTIKGRLEGMKDKDVLEIKYPELKGLGLEKVDFISDGNGRMNAVMRLEDLLSSPK